MLAVLSPAKKLDFTAPPADVGESLPRFQKDANTLARAARKLSQADLQGLMSISEDLAKLNKARFKGFQETSDATNSKQAMLVFAGDTYQGLQAAGFDEGDRDWAQDHLRILSGLYGILRPLDAIRPYRLEMGSRLKTRAGANLYAYWGPRIAEALNEQAASVGTETLVNCASVEYFSAVDEKALGLQIITPQFFEDKPNGPKIVSFFAKKARGAMARFILERRLTTPDQILDFDTGGYEHAPDLSAPGKPAFLRSEAAAEAA